METRNEIITRMLKNLTRTLGYSETEFDPFVSMLINAFGMELEKIVSAIQDSRSRVLERLVQTLCPEVLAGPLPAHAVALAVPAEHASDIYEDTQFYSRCKLASENAEGLPINEIFFTPTDTFKLNRASVRFMATGKLLFKINNDAKEVIARSTANNQLPPSTLWLGIDEPDVTTDNSLFYFSLRNHARSQLFYHHLPDAEWFCNSKQLEHLPGYGDRFICGEAPDVESLLKSNCNVIREVRHRINAYYKPYFITLHDPDGHTARTGDHETPEGVLTAFAGDEVTHMLQVPMRWIMIRFPDSIPSQLLEDVTCHMNCFPVLNRKLYNSTYRLADSGNIIPLHTEASFLDLEEVNNDEGLPLSVGVPGNQRKGTGTVLVRNGGVGRFDERDAAAAIDHLIQLLRNESLAFATMDKDFISSEMKQLQRSINRLNQSLSPGIVHNGSTPYLILNHDQDLKGNLTIKYWSTNGGLANNLNVGTILQLHKGALLEKNSAVLVSSSVGGRDELGVTEKLPALRTALLSNDRIVTSQDVRAFCQYHLGDKAKKINIQKGVMVLPGNQGGFKLSLDVIVKLTDKAYEGVQAKTLLNSYWERNLLGLLKEKSAPSVPYRVIVTD